MARQRALGLNHLPKSGEIDYIRANPVLAWQPCDTFSIAAGVMLDYSQAELQLFPAAGAQTRLRGRDNDAGFNLGLLWHPWEQHFFGVTYRSATDMNYQGHATTRAGGRRSTQGTSLNYHLPANAGRRLFLPPHHELEF